MNPLLKGNVIARLDKVHAATSHIFTDQFFEGLSVVTNALDNVAARKYVDTRCVAARTPLLESGTLGPKGHVQVILPHLTESYGSQQDPDDNSSEIPHCTLKMFPEETLHCVEWARDLFGRLFSQVPKSALKILEEGAATSVTSSQDVLALREGLALLESRPKSFADCVSSARLQFEKYFNHDIKQLLHVYPLDAVTKEGAPFWSLPKRPPTPLVFDPQNALHLSFLAAMACLSATIFRVKIPSTQPRSEAFKREVGEMASAVKVPEFVVDESAAKEIQDSVDKDAKKKEEEEKDGDKEEQIDSGAGAEADEVAELQTRLKTLLKGLDKLAEGQSYEDTVVGPEEFEKDNDSNYHIDFVHALANCRAVSYKLDPMDWIQVKLKAGRIVPAMATTTAAVAGLQTLELVKIACAAKKVDHRNIFLNLAVPLMQAGEPGDVPKTKLTDKLVTTIWDRWEVEAKGLTLKQTLELV